MKKTMSHIFKKIENTISGKAKFVFLCKLCGFTGSTSGPVAMACPKCGYDWRVENNKDRVDPILAETFEEVKS
jgi:rubrerythrin